MHWGIYKCGLFMTWKLKLWKELYSIATESNFSIHYTYCLGRPLASAWTWCCVKKYIKPIYRVFDSKTVLIFGWGPFWRTNGINRSSLMLSIVRSIACNGSLSSNFNTRSLNCSYVSLACFTSVGMVFHFLLASLYEPIHHSLQEREKA